MYCHEDITKSHKTKENHDFDKYPLKQRAILHCENLRFYQSLAFLFM